MSPTCEEERRERNPARTVLHLRTRVGERVGDDTVRVGITKLAQSSLGDVVLVQLPDVRSVTAGESFGEVESAKSVSDLYSPVTAKVVAVNGDWRAAGGW